jgi:hypothetical protein
MKKFKQALIIINLKTIAVTSLAVASTYLCRRFEITALMSLDNAEKFVERLELK